jgi:isoleucyl-tRNA synthetase
LLAPILVFTADEIWENLPGKHEASVHLAEFTEAVAREGDRELLNEWDDLFVGSLGARALVQQELERKRANKIIGSSLDAKVTIEAEGDQLMLLKKYEKELSSIFIVSAVMLKETEIPSLGVLVEQADGKKCERCWHWSETVGKDPRVPEVDERCIRQLEKGWGL